MSLGRSTKTIRCRYRDRENKCHHLTHKNIKSVRVESVVVEIITNGIKWPLFNVYKQTTVTNAYFKTCMKNILAKYTAEIINFMIYGDMNINILESNNCLNYLYGVKHIVKSPTCFKVKVPTMIDLVIINVSKSLKNICCIPL